MSQLQRRLAAIMFTDIVGYSAMMQKDEAITTRLRKRHREVFTSLTEQHQGEILQYYGDGTLSIFYSTAAAVECAVAIQRALKQDPKVPLRIGIHTGDITFSEEDIFGDGVNIASRIESLCVPGGIFVSGKVYDDIKNHQTLRAKSVGEFGLKNIQDHIPIYAITNPGITIPKQSLAAPSFVNASTSTSKTSKGGVAKSKSTATKLAFPFGLFGVHRFYLGQRFYGILYPLLFVLGITNGLPLLIIGSPVLCFLDMLIFKTMSEEEFDAKYNKGIIRSPVTESSNKVANHQVQEAQLSSQKSHLKAQFVRHKNAGEKYFNKYDFLAAIEELHEASVLKYDDAAVHFLLACCYSMLEDAKNSLAHLDAAVAFGINPQKIKAADELAFLRMQPVFKTFEKSNYRLIADAKATENKQAFFSKKMDTEKIKEENITAPPPDFLKKLQQLSELRAKGYLTEAEFLQQKERLRLK